MKHAVGVAVAAIVMASLASAETVEPSDVVFVDGAISGALTDQAGNPEEGAVLMNKGAGNCIACHAVSDLSHLAFHGEIGPPLDGVADRWTQAELRGIVADAKVMFEGTMMPSFYRTKGFIRIGDAFTGKPLEGEVMPLLTAQQVEDVVAYLMTLKEE